MAFVIELMPDLHHPSILVFSKINRFKDQKSVDAAEAALKGIAAWKHWSTFFPENGAVFNKKQSAHLDVVVWNNVSGDALTAPRREAFEAYIRHGGGFAGLHGSGGDPYCDWEWYVDTLVGARFLAHPMAPQLQEARLSVSDPADPVVRGLPSEWRMTDEWYSFKNDPRKDGAHALVTLMRRPITR